MTLKTSLGRLTTCYLLLCVCLSTFSWTVASKNHCKVTERKADCSHLSLDTVPDDLSTQIQELDLSFNTFTQLKAESFTRFKDLKVLNMRNNSISSKKIDLQAFAGLDNLETLDLSNNKINSVPVYEADRKQHKVIGECLKPLKKLRKIDYSGNQLKVLHHLTFAYADVNPDLEEIDLSNNELYSISNDALVSKDSLKRLDLSHNRLQTLSNFEATKQLQVLDLSHNQLSEVEPEVFIDLEQLQNISLAYNNFKQVPSAALSVLPSWDLLDLSGNPITVLDSDSFSESPRLRLDVLRLNNMSRLTRIEQNALSTHTDLTHLHITDNSRLSYIDHAAFSNMDTVYVLDLSNNALSSLDKFTDFNWPEMKQLSLNGNPWHCDCKLQWLKDLIQEQKLYTDFRCKSPSAVAGQLFSAVSSLPCTLTSTSDHAPSTVNYVLPVLAGVIVIVIVIGLLLFRRRRRGGVVAGVRYMSLANDKQQLITEKELL